jgi:hypothetical protein
LSGYDYPRLSIYFFRNQLILLVLTINRGAHQHHSCFKRLFFNVLSIIGFIVPESVVTVQFIVAVSCSIVHIRNIAIFPSISITGMPRTKEQWIEQLESELPPLFQFTERNRSITAHYAAWYLQKPDLFKWSGMAAFASRQVGIALVFAELMHAPEQFHSPLLVERRSFSLDPMELVRIAAGWMLYFPSLLHQFASKQFLLADLELIRKGNNAIFNDIAWAHAAYLEGGLGEVRRLCGDDEKEYLLSGFTMIDEGARLLEIPDRETEARELIREGNVKLLRHEQMTTLQPVFDLLSPPGRVVVSFGSDLDFSDAVHDGWAQASFSLWSGYWETLTGIRSVTNSRDRWMWIEEAVLPVWQGVDAGFCDNSPLKNRMLSLAACEPALIHDVKRFAENLYRIVSFA